MEKPIIPLTKKENIFILNGNILIKILDNKSKKYKKRGDISRMINILKKEWKINKL